MTQIAVLGAGPSGMAAALTAARRGARVTLYDANPQVGRKLLATGNGRCNLSNRNAAPDRYACSEGKWLQAAWAACPEPGVLDWLRELGVFTWATPDGWIYPVSNSAASVRALLAAALPEAGIELRLSTRVTDIRPSASGVRVTAGDPPRTDEYDRVVVATGGAAQPLLGSTGELFPILARLGIPQTPLRPALVPIDADVQRLSGLQGVRVDATLTLHVRQRIVRSDSGNIMFTKTGISGPPAMNLSHLVSARPDTPMSLTIDLLGEHREALEGLLARRRGRPIPLSVALGAVLPDAAAPAILALARVPKEALLSDLDAATLDAVLYQMTHLSVRVTGTRGFDQAQLKAGGVPVTAVDPATLAVRAQPRLHLAGEVLDVVGPCGGYNLHWAWLSGRVAGEGAGAG